MSFAWQRFGSTTLEVVEHERWGPQLRVTRWLAGLHYVDNYGLHRITGLTSRIGDEEAGLRASDHGDSFFGTPRSGAAVFDYAVFDYGDKPVRLAPGYDEADGARIVAWLRGQLPPEAFAV